MCGPGISRLPPESTVKVPAARPAGGRETRTLRRRARDITFIPPSTDVQLRLSTVRGEGGPEVSALMASEMGTVSARVTHSWRALERMETYQVPIVLGSAIAVLAGIVTYVVRALSESAAAAVPLGAIYLVVFGLLGLAAYGVSHKSMRNGAFVAGIAGLALLILAGGAAGFLTGLVVLGGAGWGLVKSL